MQDEAARRFEFPKPKPQPAAQQPQPAEQAAKRVIHMGWKEPVIQRAHMDLIAFFWHKWVPILDPDITPEIAAKTFAMFRANPASKEGPVRVMKMLSARIFANYVDLN